MEETISLEYLEVELLGLKMIDPTESAILSEPQFLHLLNENIIPQPFLLQKDIVRI